MKNRPFCQRVLYSFLPLVCVASAFLGGCSSKPPEAGPPIVTKAEADQVQVGMALEDAQKIIGDPGESVKVEGNVPVIPHQWVNEDGSLFKVMVKDGKVQQLQPINLK